MSVLELFDPREGPQSGWPAAAITERAYLETFATRGSRALIGNLRTQVLAIRTGERILPVTVNTSEYGDAYVCLPHTAYALYAKEELRLIDAGPWTPALGAIASGAGALMRAARVNCIVHVNNWMLSTNLHDGWRGEDISAIRAMLAERYPDHLIGVRSLTEWSDSALLARCREDGWDLLPARQIYVTDDLGAEWAPRRDSKRDMALAAHNRFEFDALETLRPGDAERIAELYALLYLDRYSALNPAFTSDYIKMTHRHHVFAYRGYRDGHGALVAIVGCWSRGGVLTTPIVGYDTTRPASDGLYRLCSFALVQMARENGLKLNGSAGAASFKRNRGARAVIEYTAYYTRHLSWRRRLALRAIDAALNKIALPIMQERGL